jgi:tRNA pseudouridine38-40 synthase
VPRYKLTIAYDGTDFCGWQKQDPPTMAAASDEPAPAAPIQPPERVRTVQQVVENAVREVVREAVQVQGASRTDSGVHARGQVAAFTCSGEERSDKVAEWQSGKVEESLNRSATLPLDHSATSSSPPLRGAGWPLSRGHDRLVRAINSRLPEDALVVAAEPVHESFNPIRDCISKGYSYTLHVTAPSRGHRPLWDRHYVHHIWTPLEMDRMKAAAELLTGEHDFAAFAAAGHGRMTTVRTVHACEVGSWPGEHDGEARVRINISGSGFLYNMVRIIAGTLVEVGRGRIEAGDIPAIIAGKDRRRAGPTFPAPGLCLEWIRYADAVTAQR